jgi:rubrerythrin
VSNDSSALPHKVRGSVSETVYVCDLCQDSGLTLVVIKDANLNNFYVTGPYTLETCPNCKGITAAIYP